MEFIDHFSENADLYARAGPTYPDALFAFIASEAPAPERAWDCATGNGQAALGLSRHFAHVDATDASAEQVANAIAAPGVRYSVQPAERTDFPGASFDAVCVAQALHWFDAERFYAEAKRVMKPRALIAAWGYARHHVTPEIDAAFEEHFLAPLKPHWPPQNAKLWAGYRDEAFPFEPVEAPEFSIERPWTLAQLIEYAGTWSATRRHLEVAPDFLELAHAAMEPVWGKSERRVVSLPLSLRCGRNAS